MKAHTQNFLGNVDIFRTLDTDELASVEEFIDTVEADLDTLLFRQGDEGDRLFIIQSGRVAITVEVKDGDSFEVAEFGPGTFFGEMSIFDKAPRSASCVTREQTRFFVMPADKFDRLVRSNPQAAIKIMYRMLSTTTERLQNSSNFLSDMVQWGEGARKRAITDEFTGLYNRRFLDDAIEEQFARARAEGSKMSVMMFDLDHFHALNDMYGMEVGDLVIKEMVPVLRGVLRDRDLPARYGGDEFIVILPDTSPEEALKIAERLVEGVREVKMLEQYEGSINSVSTSVGVAGFPAHARSTKGLRDRADEALYNAKEGGRNRAAIFTVRQATGEA